MNAPNNLRKLREARDLTLEKLAELSGLSPGYISKLETGDRDLNIRVMRKLAKPLAANPRDILPMTGISIDAELRALPEDVAAELLQTFLQTIRLAKKIGKSTD